MSCEAGRCRAQAENSFARCHIADRKCLEISENAGLEAAVLQKWG